MVEIGVGGDSNGPIILMIACSMRKLLMQVCVSFQCEQIILNRDLYCSALVVGDNSRNCKKIN